jgi:hypothetical protein
MVGYNYLDDRIDYLELMKPSEEVNLNIEEFIKHFLSVKIFGKPH